MKKFTLLILALGFSLSLAACRASGATQGTSQFAGMELTPFATDTLTPTATVTPQYAPTATLAPTLTATPITYTVEADDTLFVIAYKYGITVADLKAANPTVDPYLLTAGMTLLIPSSGGEITASQSAPAATAYPLAVSGAECTPSLTGGLYCFAELNNPQELMADSISAEFRLSNPENGEVLTQAALVPLNRLASGKSMPLFAYFEPPTFNDPQISVQINTAISVDANNGLTAIQASSVSIDSPLINISANGLSAVVSGQAKFEAAEGSSAKVWIAAVAYDETGKIVAIRRFISDGAYSAGEVAPFSMNLYSIAGKINKVVLFGEANS